MSLVRGRSMIPMRAFVKETFGDAGWQRLLGELSPAHRKLLDGLIVPDAWYDREVDVAFITTLYRLWEKDMPDLGRKIGARVAKHHDRFYLRPLLLLGGAPLIMRRAASLYRDYFQGSEMAVVERRDTGMRVAIDDPHAVRQFCEKAFPGFIEELFRLGGRELEWMRQVVCRFNGAGHCELDFEWK